MHLTPREKDKLLIAMAAQVARRRLERGVRLNHPEAVALITDFVVEGARDGRSVADLMRAGGEVLGRAQVMEGVPELVTVVQMAGTLPDGSELVTVHHPNEGENGDLTLALYGSFLPVPALERFSRANDTEVRPGEVLVEPGELVLNEGREAVTLEVVNRGDRPIQVGSHYPFFETNRALLFDRAKAYGRRLDIPAGTAVRFEPGDPKTVSLVDIAGERVVRGGNALGSGPVTPENRERALAERAARGFGHKEGA